jgi:cytochrome P450
LGAPAIAGPKWAHPIRPTAYVGVVTSRAPTTDPAELFRPGDPAFIADPYPALAAMRAQTPIFWNADSHQWVLTRFADVHEALRDRRLGRTYEHLFSHADLGRPEPDPRWARFHEHERWSLLSLEPPDHTRIRQLVSKVFTVRSVAALRPFIEATARGHLRACLDNGEFDLVTGFAQPFSVAVICHLLGVPVDDARSLLDWSHAIVKMYELNASDAQKKAADTAAAEFMDYTKALIVDKRRTPDDALVSRLVQVEEAGERLTEDEIICTTIVLLNAGHEATVNTLGNGMRAFLRHPAEWQRVVTGAVEAKTAVEEMLRWDAPLQLFERWVLEDGVVIAGRAMRIGDDIAMLFGSANRDPARFHDPDRFDPSRAETTHVGFGGGIHFCVGAPLARLEVECSLQAIVDLAPNLEQVREPEFHDAFVIRGLTELRVRV